MIEQMKTSRRSPRGVATSDLILSAHAATNADVFPQVLALHVPKGSKVADITWGKGVFWQRVPVGDYEVLASDIQTGVDCRELPYDRESLDCVVFDPPYMEGLFRAQESQMAGGGSHAAFRASYSDGKATVPTGPKWHAAVLDLYLQTGVEVQRVLKPKGVFIVKCQDEVSANRQWLTHVEIINGYRELGFYARDLFVIMRSNRPMVSRLQRQMHARKNHSYFLVFQKLSPSKIRADGEASLMGGASFVRSR